MSDLLACANRKADEWATAPAPEHATLRDDLEHALTRHGYANRANIPAAVMATLLDDVHSAVPALVAPLQGQIEAVTADLARVTRERDEMHRLAHDRVRAQAAELAALAAKRK